MENLSWWHCYSSNLKGKIADEAFSHPAKMAWGLTVRIFQHLFDEGWLKGGDLVADPFGGIGTTGLVAAAFGCPCILVELEQKFVGLAADSFSLHREQWEKMGKPYPVILQGDSRNFSSLIQEAVRAIVCSPPYAQGGRHPSLGSVNKDNWGKEGKDIVARRGLDADYGSTEGQIGAMKEGKLDEVVAVITSPPYGDTFSEREGGAVNPDWASTQDEATIFRLGVAEGQLGGMPEGDHAEVVDGIVTSPPYANACSRHDKGNIDWDKTFDGKDHRGDGAGSQGARVEHYSYDRANMGNLPEGSHEAVVDAVVTSPPYEEGGGHGGKTTRDILQAKRIYMPCDEYGDTRGNIGNARGATYWQAVSEVYQECLKALKPGGVMAVVVKAFVRKKKIVDLPSQTLELLEAIGFEPLERIRAWMTSPTTQKSLMPDIRPDYTKARKSFFRRLYESKYPENRIDFEEALIVRKQFPT